MGIVWPEIESFNWPLHFKDHIAMLRAIGRSDPSADRPTGRPSDFKNF